MNVRIILAPIAALAVLLTGCSSDGDDAASDTTIPATTEAPGTDESTTTAAETTTTTQLEADRPAPSITTPGQALDPAVCASLFEALQAITLPAEGTDGWGAQLDASIAKVDAAATAAGGYPAEQLAILRAALDGARPAIEESGFSGWQETIIAARDGSEEDDIEVQLESLRAYVLPRC